jgi:hypothetical protein
MQAFEITGAGGSRRAVPPPGRSAAA